MQSGRVDKRYTPHTYYAYTWRFRHSSHYLIELIGYTEKIRAIYFINSHSFGDKEFLFVQLKVALYIWIYLRTKYFYRCRLRGTFQE